MSKENVNIILGSNELEALSTFILKEENFSSFSYQKMKVTFEDVIIKLDSEAHSLEYSKDISNMILQDKHSY